MTIWKLHNIRKYFNTEPRKKYRYQKAINLVGLKPEHTILDIGSGNGYGFAKYNKNNKIVGLDIFPPEENTYNAENFTYVQGDGANLSEYDDKSFDLGVSIGVLEHIHPYKKLQEMAKEMDRVCKGYFIIVPHFFTPIEPHYQLPFWQFYPHFLKKFIFSNFSVGNYFKDPEGNYERLNYFSAKGWKKLFPNAKVVTHRHIWGGIISNYIIYKEVK